MAKLKALKLEAEAPKDEVKPAAAAADGEDEVYSGDYLVTACYLNLLVSIDISTHLFPDNLTPPYSLGESLGCPGQLQQGN